MRHVCVLIPARNEEEFLQRSLRSVAQARRSLPDAVTFDLVVVLDSSTDRTWEIATREVRGLGTVVSTQAGAVGETRALAAQIALERYRGPRDRCWLANTDADCVVPANWLNEQLALASSDVHAVAGIIDVDSFQEHGPGVEERFRKTYVLRPDGSHRHVHGANLGIRADLYLRAGGWSGLLTGEDHDLWNRLPQCGAKWVSATHIRVITSGRRVGRAPHGFADALAAHNESVA